jgi:transposase, IS30 family
MKIQGEKELQKYIIEKLKKGWAPQMISGRLRYIDSHLTYVSRQAIYDWLYSAYGQRYCQYLGSKQTRMKRRRGVKKTKREMIPDRVSISQRPQEANRRSSIGHWEADTIVSGKKTGSKVALCTLVDRRSRYTRMRRIENLKPESMNSAIEESI